MMRVALPMVFLLAQSAAPDFTLKNLDDQTIRLSDLKGKVVLLNFWATWCAPCRAEMPDLARMQQEYGERGLRIVGITYEKEPRDRVANAVKELGVNYPVLIGSRRLSSRYGAREVLPVTVVIDREGKIRDRIFGILDAEDFDRSIKPLLE
ncbi:MAG: TlpA disulfide reductase family protein [Acidobacteriota bacterium]